MKPARPNYIGVATPFVIARSEATRQSSIPNVELDCRASLAMTARGSRVTVSECFAMTLGAVAQE